MLVSCFQATIIVANGKRIAYMAASPMIPLTNTLARFFICKSLTIKIGRRPNAQSANEFRPETAKVKIMTVAKSKAHLVHSSRRHSFAARSGGDIMLMRKRTFIQKQQTILF